MDIVFLCGIILGIIFGRYDLYCYRKSYNFFMDYMEKCSNKYLLILFSILYLYIFISGFIFLGAIIFYFSFSDKINSINGISYLLGLLIGLGPLLKKHNE